MRRSTFIATGLRARSAGSRCACSAWRSGDGIALAHHLGRALQLTNILRDVDEDAALGRLYLPAEGLRAAGITTTEPAAVLASPALGQVCATLVGRARRHFAEADTIMARSPRRSVRAPRIMSEAYKLILDRLVARGWSPPRDEGPRAAPAALVDHHAERLHLMARTVHVVGAGLAGLAAAVRLAGNRPNGHRARGRRSGRRTLPLLS